MLELGVVALGISRNKPSASLLLATKDGSVSLPVTRAKWRNPTRRVADMALIDEALLVVVVELWGEGVNVAVIL